MHNQTITTRFHIISFQCHATRDLSADRLESEEMHSFLTEISTTHPELRKTEIVPEQITCHSDSNLAGCLQEQEDHEFMQDILREASIEIYVNNTGGCQPLEC